MRDRIINTYLADVRKMIVGTPQFKNSIISQIASDVEEYVSAYPYELTFTELEKRFGSPKEVAESIVQNMDYSAYRKHISCKKQTVLIAAIIVSFILTIIACVRLQYSWNQYANGNAAVTSTYQTEYLSEEDIPNNVY